MSPFIFVITTQGIYISQFQKLLSTAAELNEENSRIKILNLYWLAGIFDLYWAAITLTFRRFEMRPLNLKLSARIGVVLAAIGLTLMCSISISAQKRKLIPSPPSKSPENTPSTPSANPRSFEQAQLEMSILMSRRTVATDLERERNRLAAQLILDLEQLERLNTESLVPLSSSKTLDYKEVAQACIDVKSRANRIKFNSPISLIDRTGEKIRYEFDDSQIGPMLSQLSRSITKFVGNEVFRVSSPNDGELRSQAAHDLEGIIKLSDILAKAAKKMSKGLVASR